MVAAQIESERPAALKAVQEQIKLFSFTASELGLQATPTRTSPAAKTVGTRTMTKPLKSKDDIGLTGVWLAHPPKFLELEGAFTTYKSGKSVDAWLVTPSEKAGKIKFLKKLEGSQGKAPTKEQLGSITEAEFKAA